MLVWEYFYSQTFFGCHIIKERQIDQSVESDTCAIIIFRQTIYGRVVSEFLKKSPYEKI